MQARTHAQARIQTRAHTHKRAHRERERERDGYMRPDQQRARDWRQEGKGKIQRPCKNPTKHAHKVTQQIADQAYITYMYMHLIMDVYMYMHTYTYMCVYVCR